MLKTWLTNNNLWTKKGDPCTHVFMDGGRFKIESDSVEAFNNIYCESIRSKERLCIVELRSRPKFNFFVDVDFMDTEEMDNDMLMCICNICFSVVNNNDTMIACITNPRIKDDMVKTGIHLHWGTQILETDVPPIINNILTKLSTKYPNHKWKDFIDTSVYRGGGLRMKWSYKYQNNKFYDPYIPALEINKKGTRTLPSGISPWLLSKVSIRDFKSKINEIQLDKFSALQRTNQQTADPQIESWIRKNIKGQENAQVLCLYTHPHCIYIKTNSRFCSRVKREHCSNHVYFYIDLKKNTICQRCFDEQCCKCEYSSANKKIPVPLVIKYKPNPFGSCFSSPHKAVMANFERKTTKHYRM